MRYGYVDAGVPATPAAPRTGFTLVEVLVTLFLLGLVLGLTGISIATSDAPPGSAIPAKVEEGRSRAIRSGSPVVVSLGAGVQVTFRPDGSATPARVPDGRQVWVVDPWTAEVRRE